ncbi:MAG TPA: class I SAM-dependent methyltransferase [Thermoanaerobaculia bacterium]|nr:class I SAM-dependent methyltransferase [Thermoanaerobaculia bacterium]
MSDPTQGQQTYEASPPPAPALSPRIWEILVCPQCGGTLSDSAAGVICEHCRRKVDRTPAGQLDLRLTRPKRYTLELTLEPALGAENGRGGPGADAAENEVDWRPLPPNPRPEVRVGKVKGGCHLPRDVRTYFPAARGPGAMALDLGCGTQVHKEVCQLAGFEYVGLDYSAPEAMMLGDAQALPFRGDSFELVLSIAVLEHVRFPLLMLREAYRVLKPGGLLLGSVAFLEPFHLNSMHHHTHLGTFHGLRFAGFEVEHVAPCRGWTGLVAQAQMGLFPGAPRWLARTLVSPVLGLHRLWWQIGRRSDPNASELKRMTKNSGAFLFLARK